MRRRDGYRPDSTIAREMITELTLLDRRDREVAGRGEEWEVESTCVYVPYMYRHKVFRLVRQTEARE